MDFPRTVDEITPEWLTQVLRESGAIDGAKVESFVFEDIGGQGAWSEVRRIVLEYETTETAAPPSLVAKIGFQSDAMLQNPDFVKDVARISMTNCILKSSGNPVRRVIAEATIDVPNARPVAAVPRRPTINSRSITRPGHLPVCPFNMPLHAALRRSTGISRM